MKGAAPAFFGVSLNVLGSLLAAGGFVVQVYFRQRVSRIARPAAMLASFSKVWLPAHGETAVEVTIAAAELGYYDGWEVKRQPTQ